MRESAGHRNLPSWLALLHWPVRPFGFHRATTRRLVPNTRYLFEVADSMHDRQPVVRLIIDVAPRLSTSLFTRHIITSIICSLYGLYRGVRGQPPLVWCIYYAPHTNGALWDSGRSEAKKTDGHDDDDDNDMLPCCCEPMPWAVTACWFWPHHSVRAWVAPQHQ